MFKTSKRAIAAKFSKIMRKKCAASSAVTTILQLHEFARNKSACKTIIIKCAKINQKRNDKEHFRNNRQKCALCNAKTLISTTGLVTEK